MMPLYKMVTGARDPDRLVQNIQTLHHDFGR